MTPEDRVDYIAKQLYMGEIPDAWNMMAKDLIAIEIREAYLEGAEQMRERAQLAACACCMCPSQIRALPLEEAK